VDLKHWINSNGRSILIWHHCKKNSIENRNRRPVLPPEAGEEAEAEPTEQGGRGEGSRRLRGEAFAKPRDSSQRGGGEREARGLGGGALEAAGQELRARVQGTCARSVEFVLAGTQLFRVSLLSSARSPASEWWSVAVGADCRVVIRTVAPRWVQILCFPRGGGV
jgi:hypothetical protein